MHFLLINSQKGFDQPVKRKYINEPPQQPPIGLLYIASSLEDEGHTIDFLEFFGEEDPFKEIQKLLPSSDAVGISFSSFPYKPAKQIAEFIKKIDPKLPVIIGGSHCNFHPRQSLNDIPHADISVAGDGENVIKELALAVKNGSSFSKIHGIHYRKNGALKKGKSPEPITNLDSISYPARHHERRYDYGKLNNSYILKPRVTSMVTTRGCPFKCTFCPRNDYYNLFRQRSAENVVQEIQEINDWYKSVIIADENFLTDTKRAHKIMDSLIETGTTINMAIEGTRVDTANRDLYKKMKRAGVNFITFGLESGNQNVLDYYKKNITVDQIKKAVELAKEMDISTWGHFILGAPIETEKDIQQTIKFAKSLPLDIATFYPLGYVYGSSLWHDFIGNEELDKNSAWHEFIESGEFDEEDMYGFTIDKKHGIGDFTKEELTSFCIQAYKRFYYRPSYIAKQFMKAIRTQNFRILKTQMNYIQ